MNEINDNEKAINILIQSEVGGVDANNISDGYHTFGELYDHRVRLFIELCKQHKEICWFSVNHSDGTPCWEGWFIMGLFKESGKQITYHLPVEEIEEVREFAEELDAAPEFDKHSPEDVLSRLRNLIS